MLPGVEFQMRCREAYFQITDNTSWCLWHSACELLSISFLSSKGDSTILHCSPPIPGVTDWEADYFVSDCVSKCLNLVVMKPLANAGDVKDTGLIPELGRFPGEGHGYPIQYSCLENPMDGGVWRATLHRVPENRTQWKWLSVHSTHALSLRITLYIGKMFLEIKQVKAITHTFLKWIFKKKKSKQPFPSPGDLPKPGV